MDYKYSEGVWATTNHKSLPGFSHLHSCRSAAAAAAARSQQLLELPRIRSWSNKNPNQGEPSAAGTAQVSEGHRFDRGRSSAWIQSRSSMKIPPQHQTKDGGRGREVRLCSSGALTLLAAADCLITRGYFHFGARRRDLCSGRQQDSAVQEHRPTETG